VQILAGNELNQGYCKLHNLLKSSELELRLIVTEWIRTFLLLGFVVRRSMSGNFGVHWDSDMDSYLECESSGSTTGFSNVFLHM
jgi:hypothetical protein